MARKLLLVLAALALCSAVYCNWEHGEYLFDKNGIEVPSEKTEIIEKLKGDEISDNEVFALVSALEHWSTIDCCKSMDYVSLARVGERECYGFNVRLSEVTCKATKAANLRRYCEHALEKRYDYCRQHKQRTLKNFWAYEGPTYIDLARLAAAMKASYEQYLREKNLESKEPKKAMNKYCHAQSSLERQLRFKYYKDLVEKVDNDLAFLGLTPDETVEFIGAKMQESRLDNVKERGRHFKEIVATSRLLKESCSTTKLRMTDRIKRVPLGRDLSNTN